MMQQTQQTQKVVCWRHGQLPEYAKSLFALTGRIGLDAGDSDEIALRKRLAYSAPVRATYYSVECRIPRRWRAARGCHPGILFCLHSDQYDHLCAHMQFSRLSF
jgi:hypothetical protein